MLPHSHSPVCVMVLGLMVRYITVPIAHVLLTYSALQAKKKQKKNPSTLHQCQVYNEVKHKMKLYSGPHHLLLSSPA